MTRTAILASATPRLHFLVSVVGVAGLIMILRLVRRRQLRAKYSLLWLSTGVAFSILGLSPGLLDWAAKGAGVDYPPELLWLVGMLFLVLVSVHLSWEVSRLEERTRNLAEELALLRLEVERSRTTKTPDDPPVARAERG